MKLKAIHLFIILLGALILCSSLGVFMQTEGFKNRHNSVVPPEQDSVPHAPGSFLSVMSTLLPAIGSLLSAPGSVPPPVGPYPPPAGTVLPPPVGPFPPPAGTVLPPPAGPYPPSQGSIPSMIYPPMGYPATGVRPDTKRNEAYSQGFINDLQKNKKPKKHTDDNSDIYDYNSNKYKHKKKSSYIGPAGDTVIIDSPHTDYPVKHYTHKKPKSTSLGIPYSQIPTGSEDLYILKSEVIPPVCPMCPSISSCASKEPPPPCPPCARCPEPAFDCKKVPNYSNTDSRYLPVPVLSDFSQFGM